jgi:hypothetical protein
MKVCLDFLGIINLIKLQKPKEMDEIKKFKTFGIAFISGVESSSGFYIAKARRILLYVTTIMLVT